MRDVRNDPINFIRFRASSPLMASLAGSAVIAVSAAWLPSPVVLAMALGLAVAVMVFLDVRYARKVRNRGKPPSGQGTAVLHPASQLAGNDRPNAQEVTTQEDYTSGANALQLAPTHGEGEGAGAKEPETQALDMPPYEYDVAISFASADRPLAGELANRLRSAGFRVFFDDFSSEQLWGKDLLVFFEEIFRRKSRYLVIFVSDQYQQGMWTNDERRGAQIRSLAEHGSEYILPIDVDGTRLPGLPATVGYLSLRLHDIADIAELLIRKLRWSAEDMDLAPYRPPFRRHPFRHEDLLTYTLNDWVAEFHQIYHPINTMRSPTGIWLYVVGIGAEMHEDLRIADFNSVLGHMPRAFCWMCGFIMRASAADTLLLSPSLEDIALSKYPRQCFYCAECPCICTGRAQMRDLAQKRQNYPVLKERALKRKTELVTADDAPHTLTEFVKMFGDIFGNRDYDMSEVAVAARFQEAIGEVAGAMGRIYNHRLLGGGASEVTASELEDEIADAFAWLVALYRKVDYILGSTRNYLSQGADQRGSGPANLGLSLEELIWRVYARGDAGMMADPATGLRHGEPSRSL